MTIPAAVPTEPISRASRALVHDPGHAIERRDLHDVPLHRGDYGRLLLAYLTFCSVGIAVGELITHPLRHSWLQRTDMAVERWLADHRTPWMNTATFVGSELADTIVKISITVVVALAMLAIWRRWLEPLMVVVALVLEAASFITITWIVGRPRPDVPRLETSPVGSSFPSGHVAAAVVYGGIVVVVFWHTRKHWARTLAIAVVALVAAGAAFSRTYRGMHHLSDVVAGGILGLGAVLVTRAVMLRTVRRDDLRPPATPSGPALEPSAAHAPQPATSAPEPHPTDGVGAGVPRNASAGRGEHTIVAPGAGNPPGGGPWS